MKVIDEAIAKYDPDVILSIGQAGGRSEISVERIGINIDDCRIPDNAGNQIIDEPVFKDGPAAYFVNLPIKAMVAKIKEHQIPAAVSNTAGTFVCNHVMYGIMYMIDKKYPNIKGGFIHVPYIPSQVVTKPNMPSMSASDITKGLELSIKAAVENKEDVKAVGGEI